MIPRLLFLVSVAISAFAAPTPAPRSRKSQQVAHVQTSSPTSTQTYIISLKPNTVDPNARGTWLNTVLSKNNHTRRDLAPRADSDLRLTWNEKIFNGIAGSFNEAEVQTLTSLDEVKYVQPGSLLSAYFLMWRANFYSTITNRPHSSYHYYHNANERSLGSLSCLAWW
jgi:cerevisin